MQYTFSPATFRPVMTDDQKFDVANLQFVEGNKMEWM